MAMVFRRGRLEDAEACGRIAYEAFHAIASQHNFPPDFPEPGMAVAVATMMLQHPRIFSVVAERDGEVAGSNFLDERSAISGVGPITVSPTKQNAGVGRELMLRVMERAHEQRAPGVRLVQAAYHCRSLSLYTKLGFEPREPLSCMQGAPLGLEIPGRTVRPATPSDAAGCDDLCHRVHGHPRAGELGDAIVQGSARVVENGGRITGYATGLAIFSHAVGETNDDVEALIGAARAFVGVGILVPTRNGALLRWCLQHGLRIVQPMTLMSLGLYNEPRGAWLPSILF